MFEKHDETVIQGVGWYSPYRKSRRQVLKEVGEAVMFIALIALMTAALYAFALSSVPAGR